MPRTNAEIMDQLVGFLEANLKGGVLKLSRKDSDGRVNSSINEKEIRQTLKTAAMANDEFSKSDGLTITDPRDRDWIDFAVEGNGVFIPINIKVTKMEGAADNLSCKLGMFFALTGNRPDFSNSISWNDYAQKLAEGLAMPSDQVSKADYYFMVVNKDAPGDVFWTSLKELIELARNGNNLPFQCNWARNRKRVDRSPQQAIHFLLYVFKRSVDLRAKIKDDFDEHLQPYLDTRPS